MDGRSPDPRGAGGCETGICERTPESVRYRGYALEDLTEHCCFEEVAHLLIFGELPTAAQLSQLRDLLARFRPLPIEIRDLLRALPTNLPILDVIRTAISTYGHFDPVEGDSTEALQRRGIWLMAASAAVVTARARIVRRQELLEAKAGLGYAAQILHQIQGEAPPAGAERLLDSLLIVYAEHSLCADTRVARIVESTGADLVSALVGAIGAFKGTRTGGADERVSAHLEAFESIEQARHQAREAGSSNAGVPGWVLPGGAADGGRAEVLEARLRTFAEEKGLNRTLEFYDAVKQGAADCSPAPCPTIDFPGVLAGRALGLPTNLLAPIVLTARVAGWSAHYLEQHAQSSAPELPNRYAGPAARAFAPMAQR
ncbi:MAG: citrate/2-methylcitrate synthase [bacterium]|nr:citrate/2-methylcitrate synthase [bacterium]